MYLKAFIQNLVQNGRVVSEKIWFEFLYVYDIGPRSRNDLELQYSHTFIRSISCLYLPTFRQQASIVSEKSSVFTFSYRKSLSFQISPCCLIGQIQPRVIIYTNYDGLESPMLHTKFHGNRSAGSGEDF